VGLFGFPHTPFPTNSFPLGILFFSFFSRVMLEGRASPPPSSATPYSGPRDNGSHRLLPCLLTSPVASHDVHPQIRRSPFCSKDTYRFESTRRSFFLRLSYNPSLDRGPRGPVSQWISSATRLLFSLELLSGPISMSAFLTLHSYPPLMTPCSGANVCIPAFPASYLSLQRS